MKTEFVFNSFRQFYCLFSFHKSNKLMVLSNNALFLSDNFGIEDCTKKKAENNDRQEEITSEKHENRLIWTTFFAVIPVCLYFITICLNSWISLRLFLLFTFYHFICFIRNVSINEKQSNRLNFRQSTLGAGKTLCEPEKTNYSRISQWKSIYSTVNIQQVFIFFLKLDLLHYFSDCVGIIWETNLKILYSSCVNARAYALVPMLIFNWVQLVFCYAFVYCLHHVRLSTTVEVKLIWNQVNRVRFKVKVIQVQLQLDSCVPTQLLHHHSTNFMPIVTLIL